MNKEQIQQKFEDTLKKSGWIFYDSEVCANNYIEKKDLIKLLETGFNFALEVAADNADADYHRPDGQTIEVYVLKNSILKFKL